MEISRSVIAYKILRNMELDGESNRMELELKHDLDGVESEQIIYQASEEGFLRLVKDTDPKKYTLNYERLTEEWFNLWEEITGDRPIAPKNFEKFIEKYTKSYMSNEKHSTIREMLVEDFYIAINSFSNQFNLTKDFQELKNELDNHYKGKRTPKKHFKHAIQEI